MNITNNLNLPQCLVDLVEADQHEPIENRYSVTQIIGNIPELLLTRKHFNEIDIDVSNCVNTIFGTAVHELIEKFDRTGYAEMKLKQRINKYELVGKIDLYDPKKHELIDWKTTSVWKVQSGNFDDYKKQGLVYAWLLKQNGDIVEKLKFHMFVKDWKMNCDFPQIYTWEYKVKTSDLIEIEHFIYDQFQLIEELELSNDYPICEDTWYTGDKYAVYKDSKQTRADRVFDSEKEAHDYITNKLGGAGIIDVRKGQHKKCQEFCNCKYFCKYWKEREV